MLAKLSINRRAGGRDERLYVQRPGERRQRSTRQLRAAQPVEFEPSALRRDRDRQRGLRTRRDRGAAERERIGRIQAPTGSNRHHPTPLMANGGVSSENPVVLITKE